MSINPEGILASIEKNYTLNIQPRGVYFLYKERVVVYVGQGENVFQRISSHIDKSFDAYSYYLADSSENLNNIEALFIARFTPVYNRHLPPNDLFYTCTHVRHILNLGKDLSKELQVRDIKPCFYLHGNPFYLISEIAEKFSDLNGALNIAAVGGFVSIPENPPLSCALSLGASEAAG